MSFAIAKPKLTLPTDAARIRAIAKEAKGNVMESIGRLHEASQTDAGKAANRSEVSDMVYFSSDQPVELPQAKPESGKSIGSEPDMAIGYAQVDSKGLVKADFMVGKIDRIDDILYKEKEDGTEIYSAPTTQGYAIVRENQNKGTLFVELEDQPDSWSYHDASLPDATGNGVHCSPEHSKPMTLAERLKNLSAS